MRGFRWVRGGEREGKEGIEREGRNGREREGERNREREIIILARVI